MTESSERATGEGWAVSAACASGARPSAHVSSVDEANEWFQGKTAVVTGAAHGIGRATAELLDDLRAKVIAVDRDAFALHQAFAQREVILCEADLSGEVLSLVDGLLAAHGPVELLVNNVGIDTEHGFLELCENDFDLVFHTNLRGPWFLTRGFARRMVDSGQRGAIVFVSSLHDTFVRGYPHYSASKAAVSMLVKELAQALGPQGRVNAVSPGAIESARVPADQDAGEKATTSSLIPLGYKGKPHHVARMIAMLLNDYWSGYVTGANVRVDGGLGLHSWSFH